MNIVYESSQIAKFIEEFQKTNRLETKINTSNIDSNLLESLVSRCFYGINDSLYAEKLTVVLILSNSFKIEEDSISFIAKDNVHKLLIKDLELRFMYLHLLGTSNSASKLYDLIFQQPDRESLLALINLIQEI